MRLNPTLLFLLLLATRATAAIEPFYVSVDADKSGKPGIYRATLDSETGRITPPVLAGKAKGAGFLALSPNGKTLVATLARTIASYEIGANGKLSSLNEEPSGGDGPCHLSTDITGRALFVANYDGGSISGFDLAGNGVLGNRFALMTFTGSGPDVSRQAKPFAHSVYVDRQDAYVYACDLGTDSVWVFKFDPLLSKLTPTDPPAAKVPPGSGPRHLAFSADGKVVYVVNEMGLSVTTFARDPASGKLTLLVTVPVLLPGRATGKDTGAEIALHPNGRFLYVSVRGCDVMAVFSLEDEGRPRLIQNTASRAKFPRSFTIDPSGRWLIAAGQNDGQLAAFAIDALTGILTPTGSLVKVGGSLMCIMFAK